MSHATSVTCHAKSVTWSHKKHFTSKKKPKCAHGHNTAHTSVRVDSRQSDMEIQVPQYTLSRRLKR